MSNDLDELMLAYLDTIDTYQSQRAALSSALSRGFLALAQANFNTPGRRFGQDSYDERMAALRGVTIRHGADDDGAITFSALTIPAAGSESGDAEHAHDAGEDSEEETPGASEGIETPLPKPDPRDPLRWFGILVPPALRTTQSEFVAGVELVPQLLTTLSALSVLESRVARARARHVYKVLSEAPVSPLPDALPLSALDAGDGFIHLCTSGQVAGVVGRFMGGVASVWVLKIPVGRVEAGGGLRWEGGVVNGAVGEVFPHLYGAGIGAAEVLGWREFRRGGDGWGGVFGAGGGGWIEP